MPEETESLAPTVRDHLTAAAKSALGAVPFVGSLLAELAGTVIPNQRVDRLVKFAEKLETRLNELDENFVRSQLANENFTDLVEEGMHQAARSVTDERREYIANLVANGIRSDDIQYVESKHLLRVLGELNDVEVLWLRFFLNPVLGGDEKFREKHAGVFEPVVAVMGSSQRELDQAALQASYHEHLAQLGLLKPRYRTDSKTKQPIFDPRTGVPELSTYQITPLGRLLLREVGLTLSEDDAG